MTGSTGRTITTGRRASRTAAPSGRKRRAFEALAFKHLDGLFNFALHQTRNRADAEDLVQETYLRAFTRFDQFKAGTNFKAWIFTILRNTAINQFKKAARTATVDLETVQWHLAAPPDRALQDRAYTSGDLSSALEDLPAEYRTPVVLFDMEGFTYAEIAKIMGCPIGTVMSRIFRARRRLRQHLVAGAAAAA